MLAVINTMAINSDFSYRMPADEYIQNFQFNINSAIFLPVNFLAADAFWSFSANSFFGT
jgi:hypothetical protein